ncbi:MAG TPA: neutral/alkaline non-lysosomal ceramidase N-terminal domain-containing protein [Acidobacteriota bacterium]|nr:neutral/alkaline non-lysosomal ceramidase N-terminal domain-containing protein [Acidobacteriota bacterium]
MTRKSLCRVVCSCILMLPLDALTAAEAGNLRAGAAKVDITPSADAALQMSGYANRTAGFKSIHDDLNVRAIVLDDGAAQAAIISCEIIGLSHAFWEKMTDRIARETGIARENVLLASVHTHAAPSTGVYERELSPNQAAYVTKLENAILESVRQAKSTLQPARIGFGTGNAKVNVNRRAPNGEGGWMLGNNPDGVSDKTVAVIKFETPSGEPFAIFSNYGVHGTVLGPGNLQVSSDLPGATSRYVERHFGGKVISVWTSGTAGDQDPIYRVGTDFQNVTALGAILGEEVVRVAGTIKTNGRAHVRGMQRLVTCPGKRTVQSSGSGREYRFEDADPVPIRLSLLVINDIAIAGVSGEVLTNIGLRLKRESPFNRTIMITHCNGSSGYLPDDAAYDQVSYEITATRAKRGCAEDAIVNGLVAMMGAMF